MTAYGEQRYADAVEAIRGGLEQMPDHAGLHYNYACFATLAGDTGDDTFAHLRRSVELLPRFREDARKDEDFTAVRDDPRFEQALAERKVMQLRGVVLVEGTSDRAAVEALARRRGRYLQAEGVAVVPMGGYGNLPPLLGQYRDVRLAGLYDVGEERHFLRALDATTVAS